MDKAPPNGPRRHEFGRPVWEKPQPQEIKRLQPGILEADICQEVH